MSTLLKDLRITHFLLRGNEHSFDVFCYIFAFRRDMKSAFFSEEDCRRWLKIQFYSFKICLNSFLKFFSTWLDILWLRAMHSITLINTFAHVERTPFFCFFFFRNSMIDNMREIEKCKAHVQDVEVPLEVFE